MKVLTGFVFTFFVLIHSAIAQSPSAAASPRQGWGEFKVVERSTHRPWWNEALMWFPNRIMDALDMFRVDVGVGGAAGAVVRVTRRGQVGLRRMFPGSLRVGYFGRKAPFIIEKYDEIGMGSTFKSSPERDICAGEIGIGADLLIGGYAGICLEEVLDFTAGLFLIDVMQDDK
ncbi:MAG: hypothetical protein D6719_07710 [Candidatus Dadabacteria bacterium]|nr:MAG: hypothetical protein D6719_07710 [Candidatus Dadabacteria bacterium]